MFETVLHNLCIARVIFTNCNYYKFYKKQPQNLDPNDQLNETINDSAAPPTKKARKIPRILDGRYFLIQSNIDGKVSAKCQTCGEIRKGNISSTGNFKSHYKTHLPELKELEEYLKQENNDGSEANGEERRATQPRIEDMLANLVPISEDKVENYY